MAPTAVFDKNLSPDAFAVFLPGWTLIAAGVAKPKRRYVGRFKDDEDHTDVLQLGWENDAMVVARDGEMISKAIEFGRCGSYDHYLNGVIVLPVRQPDQVARFGDLVSGRLAVKNIDSNSDILSEIRDNNFGVDLRAKQPTAVELCRCRFLNDIERHKKRFKLK